MQLRGGLLVSEDLHGYLPGALPQLVNQIGVFALRKTFRGAVDIQCQLMRGIPERSMLRIGLSQGTPVAGAVCVSICGVGFASCLHGRCVAFLGWENLAIH